MKFLRSAVLMAGVCALVYATTRSGRCPSCDIALTQNASSAWNADKTLARRLTALEARVTQLENHAVAPISPGLFDRPIRQTRDLPENVARF